MKNIGKMVKKIRFMIINYILFDILIIFFINCLFLPGWNSSANANILEDMKADFIAHFDRGIKVDSPANVRFNHTGGRIIADGISGRALSLTKGQYLAVPTKDIINASEGTITLWVRPHWVSDSTGSHTFISFQWTYPKSAYFVLSRGWWESDGGTGLTYFIGNNQEATNTARQIFYNPEKWVHLACTWKTGLHGFTKLYVNGYLVERRTPASEGEQLWLPYVTDANLLIGSDKGAGNAENGRWADSDIDEFAIFKRALKDDEIARIYESIGMPTYMPIRTADGTIMQTRVMFDEGRGWMTSEGAAEIISRIKRAGFNVYVPCIWHGQGTRYPSAVAVPELGKIFTDDPLSRLIDLAHRNGIEVHPWFTITLRQRNFYKKYYDFGTPADAFDVHNPDFRKFIVDLIIDVVKRYDVDGVNLDYIRTMGICTSMYCQNDYLRQFGRDLLSDTNHRNPDGLLEPHLQRWQDETITAIVRDIGNKTKAIRSRIIISVDGHPALGSSEEGREDLSWANSGLIDIVFNMDYHVLPDYEYLNYIISRFTEPQKLIQLLGNYEVNFPEIIEPRDPELIAKSIEYTLSRWPHGVGLYLYQLLTEDQVRVISGGPFKERAKPYWTLRVH